MSLTLINPWRQLGGLSKTHITPAGSFDQDRTTGRSFLGQNMRFCDAGYPRRRQDNVFRGKQMEGEPDHLGPIFATCNLTESLGLAYNPELISSIWRFVLKVKDNPVQKETRSGRQAH